MRYCKLCSGPLPLRIKIDGRIHNLQNRHYCLVCSPFGAHNTRQLTEQLTEEARQQRAVEKRRAKGRRRYRKYQRQARRDRKVLLMKLLGGCCQICGYSRHCPSAYDFHHLDPATKVFEVGSHGLLRRWDELIAEARKCVLLCCRCHAEVHAGLHKDWEPRWNGQVTQPVECDAENVEVVGSNPTLSTMNY
jgi:hypothetical protein